jgi:hypothetical protein
VAVLTGSGPGMARTLLGRWDSIRACGTAKPSLVSPAGLTRHDSSGQLNFAVIRQKMANATTELPDLDLRKLPDCHPPPRKRRTQLREGGGPLTPGSGGVPGGPFHDHPDDHADRAGPVLTRVLAVVLP